MHSNNVFTIANIITTRTTIRGRGFNLDVINKSKILVSRNKIIRKLKKTPEKIFGKCVQHGSLNLNDETGLLTK